MASIGRRSQATWNRLASRPLEAALLVFLAAATRARFVAADLRPLPDQRPNVLMAMVVTVMVTVIVVVIMPAATGVVMPAMGGGRCGADRCRANGRHR